MSPGAEFLTFSSKSTSMAWCARSASTTSMVGLFVSGINATSAEDCAIGFPNVSLTAPASRFSRGDAMPAADSRCCSVSSTETVSVSDAVVTSAPSRVTLLDASAVVRSMPSCRMCARVRLTDETSTSSSNRITRAPVPSSSEADSSDGGTASVSVNARPAEDASNALPATS